VRLFEAREKSALGEFDGFLEDKSLAVDDADFDLSLRKIQADRESGLAETPVMQTNRDGFK